jgi:hypothetical protein
MLNTIHFVLVKMLNTIHFVLVAAVDAIFARLQVAFFQAFRNHLKKFN